MTPTIQSAMDLHRQGRLQEAENHYRSVLAASPGRFEALHLFGILKLQQGQLAEALALITNAVEIEPASLDARSNLVVVLLGLGRQAEAIEHCDRILAINPAETAALFNRGVACTQLARHDEALASFERVLAIKPDHINALVSRAGVFAGLRRHEEALADLDRLLTLVPRNPDALNNRGMMLAQLGRDADAFASFDRALAIAPDHVHALTNRAIALKKRMRQREALASLDRAIAIKPDHVEAHINRGNVLLDLHRADDALASFARALALAPGRASALTNQAFALHALGRYQEALDSAERALAADPRHDNAYLIHGHVLAKLERPAAAATSYAQALAIDPKQPFALGASLIAHRAACNWEGVAGLLPAIRQAVMAGEAVIPPFNLLGLPLPPELHLQCARNFVRQRLPAEPKLLPRRAPAAGRIRLAYVSGDFRRHPVAYLIAELIERHDRARFEVLGVSYGTDDGSEERRRLAGAFDRFADVRMRDDVDAAALINEWQADIAIDLGGHTENSRPGILQPRPAPIQVSYLGYTGTIGADFIDYVIADKVAMPLDLQPWFTEKIVHLPDCFMVNDTTKAIAADTPSRAAEGLPEQGFVFCCFNNSYKISAAVFEVWMRLLGGVEGSVLWLSQMNADAKDSLRSAARSAGIDPARIVFATRVPSMAGHLARHRLADLFVDTTDYNAHTTANDALWAGLPVLTCIGDSFPGRVAASLLHAIGLADLITTSLAEYEALALKLVRDPALLNAIRRRLEANRHTHPLFDIDRFRRHIEATYTTMHDIARRGETPRSFAVEPIGA